MLNVFIRSETVRLISMADHLASLHVRVMLYATRSLHIYMVNVHVVHCALNVHVWFDVHVQYMYMYMH